MLCRNFQRITTTNNINHWSVIVTCSSHKQSLSFQQSNTIVTYSSTNNNIYSLHYHHHNGLYKHQQREITMKAILCGGGFIYLLKKFLGIKLIQYYGWKRLYRLNHRRNRIVMHEAPDNKKEKTKKMMKLYSKIARISYDFFLRHPKFVDNWLFVDRVVTNSLLYVPRKIKLNLHKLIRREIDLLKEKNKTNPRLKYAKQWHGPLMFDTHSMVGYTNVILLSQYILISFYEKQTLFDVAFVISNYTDLLELNNKIQKKWRENPQELERKQYVNLLKLK
eukprot:440655_1